MLQLADPQTAFPILMSYFFNLTRLPKEVVQKLPYSWNFRKSSLNFAEPLEVLQDCSPFSI